MLSIFLYLFLDERISSLSRYFKSFLLTLSLGIFIISTPPIVSTGEKLLTIPMSPTEKADSFSNSIWTYFLSPESISSSRNIFTLPISSSVPIFILTLWLFLKLLLLFKRVKTQSSLLDIMRESFLDIIFPLFISLESILIFKAHLFPASRASTLFP